VKKKAAPESKTLDAEATTAAIAGFLACHVLTAQFLVQEGIVDRERFLAFLETALEGMRPGLADQRSLFPLTQIINALRAPGDQAGLQ
jgi:hypothetical protein